MGRGGSGTIFFTHCNLLCSFCQNYDISHEGAGQEIEPEGLARVMLNLQDQGCHNINFVSPSHVIVQILEALPMAIEGGLRIPLVYNTGGYDLPETIRRLEGVVDIYMPDVKFGDGAVAEELAQAPDYPLICRQALSEMHRQVGDLCLDEAGVAWKGLLIRHLVMPDASCRNRRDLCVDCGPPLHEHVHQRHGSIPSLRNRARDILPCRDGSRAANTKKPSKLPDDAGCIGSTSDEPSESSGADPLHHAFLAFPDIPQAKVLHVPRKTLL